MVALFLPWPQDPIWTMGKADQIRYAWNSALDALQKSVSKNSLFLL